MTRGLIAAGVVIGIATLVALANFVVINELEQHSLSELKTRNGKLVANVGQKQAKLKSLERQKTMEQFSADMDLGRSIKAAGVENEKSRADFAQLAFSRFKAQNKDLGDVWLLDSTGQVVARPGMLAPTEPSEFLKDGKVARREIQLALEGHTLSSFWVHGGRLMRIGLAPVLEIDEFGEKKVIGAVVAAGEVTSAWVKSKRALREELAYYYDDTVYATSLRKAEGKDSLTKLLQKDNMAMAKTAREKQLSRSYELESGKLRFIAAAGRLPITSTKQLPKDITHRAGFMVLLSVDDALAPLDSTRKSIWLIGGAAIILALLGMWLTARRLISQADELQMGVSEVVGGNVDHIFPPVGKEMDGLSHGLNVMLSRLLGRPEPGEDGFGDQTGRTTMAFEQQEMSEKDATNAALAAEPEQDYYKRIYEEYIQAKSSLGEESDISFDKFIAKVRLNEGALKKRFACESVRFKIIIKDNKVTLKPVPIM